MSVGKGFGGGDAHITGHAENEDRFSRGVLADNVRETSFLLVCFRKLMRTYCLSSDLSKAKSLLVAL